MKHLKQFENNITEPQVGDYVSCEDIDEDYVHNFLSNNIGRIKKIVNINDTNPEYWPGKSLFRTHLVEFDKEPDRKTRLNYIDFTRTDKNRNTLYYKSFNIKQIVAFGKTKEEVETKLAQKKYNV